MLKNRLSPPLVEHTSAEESVEQIEPFRNTLRSAKQAAPHPQFGWYPYDTLSNWWILHFLFAADFSRLQHALKERPVLDIGCGDGDLAFFLSFLGCRVTALDYPGYNFNSMHGVKTLKSRLSSDLQILEIDLDADEALVLPETDYALVLLLGILYHLKNPFSILEKLARRARFCMLSTRIAAMTPAGAPMQHESLAYLLDSGEANNDSTNFWIFSETGLLRLLKRTEWEVRAFSKHGCLSGSNPSSNGADERMFLFLRSRLLSAPARLKLVKGWWPAEAQGWCWVDKHFRIDLSLTEKTDAPEFELRVIIPDPASPVLPVELTCSANGSGLESKTYTIAGEQTYRAKLPESIDTGKPIRLEFRVTHSLKFGLDSRDLGVIVPCRNQIAGTDSPISFWVA